MSNVRDGVRNNSASSYWRHLRPIGKRLFWKRHRKTLRKCLSEQQLKLNPEK